MREKFCHRDLCNSGELSMEEMRDLLNELRDDAIKMQASMTDGELALQKAAQRSSPLGKLVASAGLT